MAFDIHTSRWDPHEPRKPWKNHPVPILWRPSDAVRWPIIHFHDIGNEITAFVFGQSNRISRFGCYGLILYLFTGFTLTLLVLMLTTGVFAAELIVTSTLTALLTLLTYILGVMHLLRR